MGACHRTALTVRTRRGGTSWKSLFFAFPSASMQARWDRSRGVLTCVAAQNVRRAAASGTIGQAGQDGARGRNETRHAKRNRRRKEHAVC